MTELEKENDALKDEIIYLQSQSMRNNLILFNRPEAKDETNVQAKFKIKVFIIEKMNIAKAVIDKISIDRDHKMGRAYQRKTRNIIAKFYKYKETEMCVCRGKHYRELSFMCMDNFLKRWILRYLDTPILCMYLFGETK